MLAEIPDVQVPPRVSLIKKRLLEAVQKRFVSASIYPFGSSVNGFGDEKSDVDLVVAISEEELRRQFRLPRRELAPAALQSIAQELEEVGVEVLEEVLGAKVPILKLKVDGAWQPSARKEPFSIFCMAFALLSHCF